MGFVFAKAALDYFPPILLMAFRFLVTALAFAGVALIAGQPRLQNVYVPLFMVMSGALRSAGRFLAR